MHKCPFALSILSINSHKFQLANNGQVKGNRQSSCRCASMKTKRVNPQKTGAFPDAQMSPHPPSLHMQCNSYITRSRVWNKRASRGCLFISHILSPLWPVSEHLKLRDGFPYFDLCCKRDYPRAPRLSISHALSSVSETRSQVGWGKPFPSRP